MTDSIQTSDKNRFQWRTITALGAATWLVTTQLSGCGADSQGEGEGEHGEVETTLTEPLVGGEGGEGEGAASGGEGEGATASGIDLATDDVAYLTQLGLIRGHLAVGYALYSNNLPELAETHMKHPREEIYATVLPAFEARGCPGFGDNLSALTAAVTERHTQAQVDEVYQGLTQAIRACEIGADETNPATITKVIENLLRTGGVEYEIGIVDQGVNNLHEYQDAWGFTQIAMSLARSDAYLSDAKATAVAAQIQDIINGLEPMWPSLNPEGSVAADAAQLYGAAAQVQVAGFTLAR